MRKKGYEDESYEIYHSSLNDMKPHVDDCKNQRLKYQQLTKDAEQCIQERDNRIACDAESLKALRKKVKTLESKCCQYQQDIDNLKDKNLDYYQQIVDLSIRLETKSSQLMKVNKELDKNLMAMNIIKERLMDR